MAKKNRLCWQKQTEKPDIYTKIHKRRKSYIYFSHFHVCGVNPQVPNEYLRPQQETAVHIGEFMLFYRTLPLRLKIEKQHFHFNGNSFTLKCEATFGRYTHLTRAKSTRVFIDSADDLTNQKLVNSKSAAAAPATGNPSILYILLVLLCYCV